MLVLDDELVSEACRVPKPLFFEEPTKDVVREIKDFIKATGRPQDWRGHTHTKPPAGARPKYLDEFDVPTFGRKVASVAPCPCCTPNSPKYKRNGKIAWFEDEGLIRLIGPDCFANMNAEGHAEAMRELGARKAREKAIRHLSGGLPRLRSILELVKQGKRTGMFVDQFRSELTTALDQQDVRLWDHCRGGELKVNKKSTETYIDPDGAPQTRTIFILQPYAPLRGHDALRPNAKSLELAFDQVRVYVERVVEKLQERPSVGDWGDQDLREALRVYNNGRDRLRKALAEVARVQSFVGPIAVPTLKRWSAQKGCPIPFFIDRQGTELRIGSGKSDWIKVNVPSAMDDPLPAFNDIDLGETD